MRLLSTAAVVLAVLAGAYWLVRPPAATTESTLPFARSASAPTTVTVATDDHASGAPIPDAPPATTGEVVVHVAGAVAANGVYRLPSGSRVIDAVQSAGGLSADAQPDAVNLAALLTDGARVYVPRVGETVPPFVAVAEPVPTTPQGPVNLNTATAGDLDSLPGIGPATAAAIVAYRDQQGPFASVDDLADVRGIGPAKVEALRGLVTT